MIDLDRERLKRNMPVTQEDCCAVAVRRAIAVKGAVTSPGDIRAACRGLAEGLFGEAFDAADDAQRKAWVDMMQAEYIKAISSHVVSRNHQPQ